MKMISTSSTQVPIQSAQVSNIQNSLHDLSATSLVLTKHAKARVQQRGIQPYWITLVLEYGKEAYQKGKHSYSFSLDKLGLKRIKDTYGAITDINKLRQLYVVVSEDGAIVTCAYR